MAPEVPSGLRVEAEQERLAIRVTVLGLGIARRDGVLLDHFDVEFALVEQRAGAVNPVDGEPAVFQR